MAYPFPVSMEALCKEARNSGLTPAQFESLIGLPRLHIPCNSESQISTSIPESPPFSPSRQGDYTYQDYASLPAHSRTQLIDGYLTMEHNVSLHHQRIITELLYQIVTFLEANHSPFKVISSPLHLLLPNRNPSVLLPDIALIRHPEIITKQTVKAVPLFAAEIISPSTYCLDTMKIKDLYRQSGVTEYWTIGLESQCIRTYQFQYNTLITMNDFDFLSKIPVHAFSGLTLDFTKLVSLLR